MINLKSLTFGTDAELFLQTKDGRAFPVCGLVGGTKEEPKKVTGLFSVDGFAVQEDNAALEFNVPPTNRPAYLRAYVERMKEYCESIIPPSLNLDCKNSAVVFSKEYLSIPQINAMGCEPDYNAWSMTMNSKPRAEPEGLRSAAAHIHLGWADPTEEDRINLIRFSDIFAILPLIAEENETEKLRRQLYGKAGAFRWKKYGVEHRVPSNKWIFNLYSDFSILMRGYFIAVAAVNSNFHIDPVDFQAIQDAINQSKGKEANFLHEKYKALLDTHLGPQWNWKSYFTLLA